MIYLYKLANNSPVHGLDDRILVTRGRALFGQHQESRPARTKRGRPLASGDGNGTKMVRSHQEIITRSVQLPHIFLSRLFHRPIYFYFEFTANHLRGAAIALATQHPRHSCSIISGRVSINNNARPAPIAALHQAYSKIQSKAN